MILNQRSSMTSGNNKGIYPFAHKKPCVNVDNVQTHDVAPKVRKYKKIFKSEILCAAGWDDNLLVGTESSLILLDRTIQQKVYQLISQRRFQQIEVLEDQNILVTLSGNKYHIRVYYLSWLKNNILKINMQSERQVGWVNVGDLEGAVHFKVVKYEKINFLVIAFEDSIEMYAWAPKPYNMFMAFKSFVELTHKPILVDLTVEEGSRFKVIYGSSEGFHAIDVDSASAYDLYTLSIGSLTPHAIVTLPDTNGIQLLLCYDNQGIYVNTYGKVTKNKVLNWNEMPTSVAHIGKDHIIAWENMAIEICSVYNGQCDGVFTHKKGERLKFLCEKNGKIFFSSCKSNLFYQIYFIILNKSKTSHQLIKHH